jgi:hypothetical protein
MKVIDHPGNLGPARGSLVTVLHADWPAYPYDSSLEALFQLAAFPTGTKFLVIDDIDRALLLLANIRGADLQKPFGKENFHVAVWHEDLAELSRQGFVEGVKPMTEQEWREFRRKELQIKVERRPIGFSDGTGNFIPISGPSPGQYEDDPDWMPFIGAPDGRILVTTKGREFVRASLKLQHFDIGLSISNKVQKLFELQFFDTCVREACVQLEYEIKQHLRSEAYGERLTTAFTKALREQQLLLESAVRTLGQEVRSVFKLIRNNFMHNLTEVDDIGALVILIRISRARSLLHLDHGLVPASRPDAAIDSERTSPK